MRLGHPVAVVAAAGLLLASGTADATLRSGHLSEVQCLALNVYHEARGEPEAGRVAVAAVTMNRVRSKRFPNSVCAVVWQPGQFSWTSDGRSDVPRDKRAWRDALRIAGEFYALGRVRGAARASPVGRAVFFHTTQVRPGWARDHQRVARVGRHIFYE